MKCTYIMFKDGKSCELDREKDQLLLNALKTSIEFDFYNQRFKPGHTVPDNMAETAHMISWGHDITDILKFEKEFWDYLIHDAEIDGCHIDYINQLKDYKEKIINQHEPFNLDLLD
ncbi:hypothetical protein [Macrococcus bovicus]|uniref:hypothetical protein n=1 Tax=Macrococcus bovicus TaxID=69968 RepID=UPI0025A63CAA|nr:hypothetical protein [Macrococcus bovicus]WJP96719.1 hypothetical protein QSV55_00335 [Macrococcus bovicus]